MQAGPLVDTLPSYKDGKGMGSKEIRTHLHRLRKANPSLYTILSECSDLEELREGLRRHLSKIQAGINDPEAPSGFLERIICRDAARVFHDLLQKGYERMIGFSTIGLLHDLVQKKREAVPEDLSPGYFEEYRHLFIALSGKIDFMGRIRKQSHLSMEGRKAARVRSDELDIMSRSVDEWLERYPSGLDEKVVKRRMGNRRRILDRLGSSTQDWQDHRWHIRNVVRNADDLEELVEISERERAAIDQAKAKGIPFGITPYYVHLMDNDLEQERDLAVRAQVIPSMYYVEAMSAGRKERRRSLDFMGEASTSPIDLVTRRYPKICIIKPYNACPQVCVYCQRNWEIDDVLSDKAFMGRSKIEEALEWIRARPTINELLVTGGDPLVMSNSRLADLMEGLTDIDHIDRIRIGTRMPVTVPFRLDEGFVDLVARAHEPGRREICLMTHFEHPYEVTPEVVDAIRRLRRVGISIYNQLVYTTYVSRRFEAMALRKVLRLAGIVPYYTFVTKGKEETGEFRVPIPRLLQEEKEEKRRFPGVLRTDHSVFNVPRLGKNYISRMQHHSMISIMPNGRRIYEFHPWEKKIVDTDTYIFEDVSIYDYLKRLEGWGESPKDYETIWYYY